VATPNQPVKKKNAARSGRGELEGRSPSNKKPAAPGKGEGGVRVSHAEFAAGVAQSNQMPTTDHFEQAPEIAFAGRSNVGKSSLLNMMLARKGLARTSNTPGCTRQINFFEVGLAQSTAQTAAELPSRLVFVDLPGYGYAKVSKSEASAWKQLLEGYLHERPTLRAVVILVDVRRGLEQEEIDLIEFLAERPTMRMVVAATKIDKLPRSAQKPALAELARGPDGLSRLEVVATSAETGAGREQLWGRILDACRVE
jgi:GTP-binding protein